MNIFTTTVRIFAAALFLVFSASSNTILAQTNTYLGPVPRITTGFGANGTFQVDTLRFPATGWDNAPNQTVQNVLVFAPRGVTEPRPTLMFAHGYGGFDVRFYGEILQHVASLGYVAVFVPYPITINFPALYRTMDSGFAEAVRRYPRLIDSTRIGFMGHSFGGGAIPSIAHKAYTQRAWGRNGKFLFPMAPWFSLETTTEMTRTFPSDTKLIMQIYRDDRTNDHRMAMDIFRTINIPASEKDFITILPDTVNNYIYSAGHGVCNTLNGTGANASAFDAYDVYGIFRLLDALMEYTFNPGNSTAKNVALGNGSADQIFMGTVGNRTVKPLRVTDTPTPDPLAPVAQFQCNNDVNIRRELCDLTTSVAISSSQYSQYPQKLIITPNPSNDEASAQFTPNITGKARLTLTNLLGQELFTSSRSVTDGIMERFVLPVNTLAQGAYQCRVQIGERIWMASLSVRR